MIRRENEPMSDPSTNQTGDLGHHIPMIPPRSFVPFLFACLFFYLLSLSTAYAIAGFDVPTEVISDIKDVISMDSGDYNGDGYPDLAVYSQSDKTIYFYRNNQDGTYSDNGSKKINRGIGKIQFADLNLDGQLDLVYSIVQGGSSGIYVLKGDGGSTWGIENIERRRNYQNALDFQVVDVYGDSHPDVVVLRKNDAMLIVLEIKGNFSLRRVHIKNGPEGTNQRLVVGDFNEDNRVDALAIDDENKQVYLYDGVGNGSTKKLEFGSIRRINQEPKAVVALDWNQDGYHDFVVATKNNKLIFFRQNSKGSKFSESNLERETTKDVTDINQLAVGDLDLDGDLDLLYAGNAKANHYLLNRGGSFTSGQETITTDKGGSPFLLVDVNKNGSSDLIAWNSDDNNIYQHLAKTSIKNEDTGKKYASLKQAIVDVSDSETIEVSSSASLIGNLVIDGKRNVTLKAQTGVVLQGQNNDTGITVRNSSNITLDGFTITNFTNGIVLESSSADSKLMNLAIGGTGRGRGIEIQNSGTVLSNVEVTNYLIGIDFNGTHKDTIIHSRIHQNDIGIYVRNNSTNILIMRNRIYSNNLGLNKVGIDLRNNRRGSPSVRVISNNIFGQDVGVQLRHSRNIKITHNRITDHSEGITLNFIEKLTLARNLFLSNGSRGIYKLSTGKDLWIVNNTFLNQSAGIIWIGQNDGTNRIFNNVFSAHTQSMGFSGTFVGLNNVQVGYNISSESAQITGTQASMVNNVGGNQAGVTGFLGNSPNYPVLDGSVAIDSMPVSAVSIPEVTSDAIGAVDAGWVEVAENPVLVAHYPFDGDAKDNSGNSYHGTPRGRTSLTNDRFIQPSSAYHFNNSEIDVPDSPFSRAGDITIATWAYIVAGTVDNHIFSDWSSSHRNFLFNIKKQNGGYKTEATSGDGNTSQSATTLFSNPLQTNVWHHLVYQRDGNTLKIYVNGKIASSTSIAGNTGGATGNDLRIGAFAGDLGGSFEGKLDDLYFYSSALSPMAISNLAAKPSFVMYLPGGAAITDNQVLPISGVTAVGETNGGVFTISNVGIISNLDLVGGVVYQTDSVNFSVLTNPLGASIAPNQATNLTLAFTPQSVGTFTNTFTISNSDFNQPNFSFKVIGTSVLDANMIAYYPFNGDADDENGGGFDGSPQSGVVLSTDRFGNAGSAYSFDGSTSSYIDLPDGIVSNAESLSFGAWINPSELSGGWPRVFDFGDDRNNYLIFSSSMSDSGFHRSVAMEFRHGGPTATNIRLDNTNNESSWLNPNEWVHIAGVLDAATDTVSIYINGALANSGTGDFTSAVSNLGNTTNNWLGRSQFSMDKYFKGSMDDLYFYKKALTGSEVSNLAAHARLSIHATTGVVTNKQVIDLGVFPASDVTNLSLTLSNVGVISNLDFVGTGGYLSNAKAAWTLSNLTGASVSVGGFTNIQLELDPSGVPGLYSNTIILSNSDFNRSRFEVSVIAQAIDTVYVSAGNGNDGNGGVNTNDAVQTIQTGIDIAIKNSLRKIYVDNTITYQRNAGLLNTPSLAGIYITNVDGIELEGGWDAGFRIQGNKTILDTDESLEHVLWISNAKDTTVQGFEFRKGKANSVNHTAGGGILAVYVSNLSLDNLAFSSNFALEKGGAIYLSNADTIKVENSDFTDNRSDGNGAAIYLTHVTNATMNALDFKENIAQDHAGAIYTINTSNVTITNSGFEENEAVSKGGGAIKIEASVFSLVIDGEFRENKSISGSGGAVDVESTSDISIDGLFIGNSSAKGGAISLSIVSNAKVEGGFVSNHATNAGLISINDSKDLILTNLMVKDHTLSKNLIHFGSAPNDQFTLVNSVFSNINGDIDDVIIDLDSNLVIGSQIDIVSNIFHGSGAGPIVIKDDRISANISYGSISSNIFYRNTLETPLTNATSGKIFFDPSGLTTLNTASTIGSTKAINNQVVPVFSTANVASNIDINVEYNTVQTAINAASANETILVYPGIHTETLDFGGMTDITLRASAWATNNDNTSTIFNGPTSAVARITNSTGISLEGFTFSNLYSISIGDDAEDTSIKHNRFLSTNSHVVEISDSSVDGVAILSNTFVGADHDKSAIHIENGPKDISIISNVFQFYQNPSVFVSNAGPVHVLSNYFYSNDVSVRIQRDDNGSVVLKNSFNKNRQALEIYPGTRKIEIVSNEFTTNAIGIYGLSVTNNGYLWNQFIGNTTAGMIIDQGNDEDIAYNLFVKNAIALKFTNNSRNITSIQNTFFDNTDAISFYSMSPNDHINSRVGNSLFINNTKAIEYTSSTNNSKLFNNAYFGNTENVSSGNLGMHAITNNPAINSSHPYNISSPTSPIIDKAYLIPSFNSNYSGLGPDIGWQESSFSMIAVASNVTTGLAYATIYSGIEDLASGEELVVFDGTYSGDLFVEKKTNVIIRALNAHNATINGSENHGFRIEESKSVRLEGFVIENASTVSIRIKKSDDLNITNNILKNSPRGIIVGGSQNQAILIVGNELVGMNSGQGIHIADGSLLDVRNNKIHHWSRGVRVISSATTKITSNYIHENKYGLSMGQNGSNAIEVKDTRIVSNLIVNNSESGILFLTNSFSNNHFYLNEISNNQVGVIFESPIHGGNHFYQNNIHASISGSNVGNINSNSFLSNYWGTINAKEILLNNGLTNTNEFAPYRLGPVDMDGLDNTSPDIPSFTGVTNTNKSIYLEWATVPGAVGYKIYRSINDSWTNYDAEYSNLGAVTFWQDTNVALGETYYYHLTSYDNALPYSNESFFSASTNATLISTELTLILTNITNDTWVTNINPGLVGIVADQTTNTTFLSYTTNHLTGPWVDILASFTTTTLLSNAFNDSSFRYIDNATNVVTVLASNIAGSFDQVTITNYVDTTAPTVSITSPVTGKHSGTTNIVYTFADSFAGLSGGVLMLSQHTGTNTYPLSMLSNYGTFTNALDTTAYPNGDYGIHLIVSNIAGMQSITHLDITISNVSPLNSIAITGPTNYTAGASRSVTLQLYDKFTNLFTTATNLDLRFTGVDPSPDGFDAQVTNALVNVNFGEVITNISFDGSGQVNLNLLPYRSGIFTVDVETTNGIIQSTLHPSNYVIHVNPETVEVLETYLDGSDIGQVGVEESHRILAEDIYGNGTTNGVNLVEIDYVLDGLTNITTALYSISNMYINTFTPAIVGDYSVYARVNGVNILSDTVDESNGEIPYNVLHVDAKDVEEQFEFGSIGIKNNPIPPNENAEFYFRGNVGERVNMKIFNLRGMCVRTLIDRTTTGIIEDVIWDLKSDNGQKVSAGLYYVVIQLGDNKPGHAKLVVSPRK